MLFKKKMSPDTLATMLMIYTLQGDLDNHDGGSAFAFGPRRWPTTDGQNFRPEAQKRNSWNELSGHELFKKEMEVCFLRGWAISFMAGHLMPEKFRRAAFEHYASMWEKKWPEKFAFLRRQWEGAHQIYGAVALIQHVEQGRNIVQPTSWRRRVKALIDTTSNAFVELCDYNKNYSDELRAQTKEEGSEVFTQALAFAGEFLSNIQKSHKLTT
jgi:hypothetical protein